LQARTNDRTNEWKHSHQNKNRRNKMLRKIATVSACALTSLPMIVLSGSMAFAAPAPKVTVFNQGGYVADYQVSYTVNGKQRMTTANGLVVGKKKTITLPANSTSITVTGQMKTGLFWEPKRQIFKQPANDGSCFKTYGTIIKADWSTDCTADF
jgi:Thiol-activated cytolysin beta sandwich domain